MAQRGSKSQAAVPARAGDKAGDKASGRGDAARGGGGTAYMAVTPLTVGLTAFATVYLLPLGTAPGMTSPSAAHFASSPILQAAIEPPGRSLESITFVALEPLVVSLGSGSSVRHLKISLTLETSHEAQDTVARATPKLRDAFTGYLRAVRFSQLDDPSAMARIRAQLLRRAKVVLGERQVGGVLITDFVLT